MSVASVASKESGSRRGDNRSDMCLSTWSDGKDDLSFRLRPYVFEHQMSLAHIREGEDCSHVCSQLSGIDQASNLRQIMAGDVDQEESCFDAMALRELLIRTG